MLFKERIAVFFKNNVKPVSTFSGQNAELVNIKECDIKSIAFTQHVWNIL
jgi:hypothetical protein